MSTSYTMSFWGSTQNSSDTTRPVLLSQAYTLAQALSERLVNQIVIPSQAKDMEILSIEIAVLYETGTDSGFPDIGEFLTTKATELNLEFTNFVKQPESVSETFTNEELDRIKSLSSVPLPPDFSVADFVTALDELTARQALELQIPGDEITHELRIPQEKLGRLRTAEGDDLFAELKGMLDKLNTAMNANKSAWATILMVAGGIFALKTLPTAYKVVQMGIQFASIFIAAFGVSGLITLVAPIVAALGLIIALLTALLKGDMNILLVVNTTSTQVSFQGDSIINGERGAITQIISAAVPGDRWIPAGLFYYQKYTIRKIHVGFYGSLVGISFTCAERDFSVGMDCPNTILGGTNSIRIIEGHDAQVVAELARDSSNESDRLETGAQVIVVKRANKLGSVNWGVCLVD